MQTLACVAGVKRGRGRGNFARQSLWGGECVVPFLLPPLCAVSRSNSLPLPFRTPATQAMQTHKLLQPPTLNTISYQ